MAKRNKKQQKKDDRNIVAVEEALSKSEQFIERNQNSIIYAVAVIVILISGYIGYTRFILSPRERTAQVEIFMAEKRFDRGDYEKALLGDAEYPGFLDIMSDFRMTKTANLARYYAGISHMRLGEWEEGINYLKRFRTRDQILGSMRYGAIGDAYWELGDLQRAARYYRKAYQYKPDNLTTPAFLFKAAQLFEYKGEYGEAIKLYEQIRREYTNSNEGRDIEKFIARAKASK